MPDLTVLLLVTVTCLATAFVWMFCELERYFDRRRHKLAIARIRAPRIDQRDRQG
jgi:flavin reductase (DIM6/NTAB) family NADH-FMN oxidoreductase RutF